jgi:hypothetical protein
MDGLKQEAMNLEDGSVEEAMLSREVDIHRVV